MNEMKLDTTEKLKVHILGLEAALTKRNETIERLENKIQELMAEELTSKAYRKAFKEGFEACSNQLVESVHSAALALGNIRRDAIDAYIDAQQRGVRDE